MRFRSDPASVRGSIAPVVTPFTAAGDLDEDSLRSLVRWQLDVRVARQCRSVARPASRARRASPSASRRWRVVAEEIGDRVPFVPGTGSAKLDETLEMTEAAIGLGADIVLVITPYYARPTQDGLFAVVLGGRHRRSRRSRSSLYNVPVRTAVDVAPETVARLRRAHDNIVGIKETTKDFEHYSRTFHLCGRDLLMWSGIELLCLPLAGHRWDRFRQRGRQHRPHGGRRDVRRAGSTATASGALDLHYGLHPLVDLMFVETNPAPIKHVLQRGGLIASDHVRLAARSRSPSAARRRRPLDPRGAPGARGPAGRARPGDRRVSARARGAAMSELAPSVIGGRELPARIRHYIDGQHVDSIDGAHARGRRSGHATAYAELSAGNADDVDARRRCGRPRLRGVGLGRPAGRRALETCCGASPSRSNGAADMITAFESFDTGLPVTQARGPGGAGGRELPLLRRRVRPMHEDAFRAANQFGYVIRRPKGVAGLITPWNVPFMLATWKIAPCLAAGCTVVLKPAELTPLSASLFPEIMEEAGLPAGVFNIVHGVGEEAGAALVAHPDVPVISFTGETVTGKLIMRRRPST